MKNKGVLKQIQDSPVIENDKVITLKDIRDATDYVFKDYKLKEVMSTSLRVVQNSEYHYYKISNGFTTGFEGFISFMKLIPNRDLLYPIYFNDEELNEKQTKQFWEQVDKFSAK